MRSLFFVTLTIVVLNLVATQSAIARNWIYSNSDQYKKHLVDSGIITEDLKLDNGFKAREGKYSKVFMKYDGSWREILHNDTPYAAKTWYASYSRWLKISPTSPQLEWLFKEFRPQETKAWKKAHGSRPTKDFYASYLRYLTYEWYEDIDEHPISMRRDLFAGYYLASTSKKQIIEKLLKGSVHYAKILSYKSKALKNLKNLKCFTFIEVQNALSKAIKSHLKLVKPHAESMEMTLYNIKDRMKQLKYSTEEADLLMNALDDVVDFELKVIFVKNIEDLMEALRFSPIFYEDDKKFNKLFNKLKNQWRPLKQLNTVLSDLKFLEESNDYLIDIKKL